MKTATIGADPKFPIHGHAAHQGPRAAGRLRLHRADTYWARLLGLHAYRRLPWHAGLYLAPCKAVHTMGLRYAIDVVFLDRHRRVIRRRDSLPPWRCAVCSRAASVVELPAGYCAAYADWEQALELALRRL